MHYKNLKVEIRGFRNVSTEASLRVSLQASGNATAKNAPSMQSSDHVFTRAQRTRVHFFPQQRLLCPSGLY
jgi:hypothetical protein